MNLPPGMQGRLVPTRRFRKAFECRYCGMLWKLGCFRRRHEKVCPKNPDHIKCDPVWGTRFLQAPFKNDKNWKKDC